MLKKWLASLGVGSIKVDLHLKKNLLTMGEKVSGTLDIHGGIISQVIEGGTIQLYVFYDYYTRRKDRSSRRRALIQTFPILMERATVEPNQKINLPFTFVCPENLAVSAKMTEYALKTELEIQEAKNATRTDYSIKISASGLLKNFLDGCKLLKMSWIHEGYTGPKTKEPKQFIYFLPPRAFRDRLDEILFEFNPHDTDRGVYGTFRLIQKGESGNRGWTKLVAGDIDLARTKETFHFTPKQLKTREHAQETLKQFITDQIKHISRS